MKKTFTSSFLGLAISGLLLASCSQMASYENEDLALEQASADKAGFTLSPYGSTGGENAMLLDGGGDYTSDCITDESGSEFMAFGSLSGQWGNPQNPNEKTLDVQVWNTLTTIEYRFTLVSEDMNNSGNLQYFDEDLDDWVNVTSLTFGEVYPVSRPLPAGWSAGDVITEQWRNTGGGGSPLEAGDVSYALIGICTETTITEGTVEAICTDEVFSITATVSSYGDFTGGMIQIWDASDAVVASADVTESVKSVTYDFSSDTDGTFTFTAHYVGAGSNGYNDSSSEPINVEVIDCGGCDEESFSYVATVAGTNLVNIVFSYDAAEPLVDAEVKFTFPQIQDVSIEGIYSAPDGKVYSVNNNGNNTVFTWIGDIGCTDDTSVTFEFEVMADCNSSDKAQIWTSATVNGVGVKNEETPNIRFICATQEIEESDED